MFPNVLNETSKQHRSLHPTSSPIMFDNVFFSHQDQQASSSSDSAAASKTLGPEAAQQQFIQRLSSHLATKKPTDSGSSMNSGTGLVLNDYFLSAAAATTSAAAAASNINSHLNTYLANYLLVLQQQQQQQQQRLAISHPPPTTGVFSVPFNPPPIHHQFNKTFSSCTLDKYQNIEKVPFIIK